jgi:serine/threonine-protein kinase SRPK3
MFGHPRGETTNWTSVAYVSETFSTAHRSDDIDQQNSSSGLHNKPNEVYEPISYAELPPEILAPHPVIIDFGETILINDNKEGQTTSRTGFTWSYSAPELFFDHLKTKPCDIWSLACCIFEIRSGAVLFSSGFFANGASVIEEMINALGPLPEPWVCHLPEHMSNSMTNENRTLKQRVQYIGAWPRWCYWTPEQRKQALLERIPNWHQYENLRPIEEEIHRGPNPHEKLTEEERVDFVDLLGKMLRYNPDERASIADILEHPWFHKDYQDVWALHDAWFQKYDPGRRDWGFYEEDAW